MTKKIILFIPGIKGSELWEGDNKRWFPKNKEDFYSSAINNPLEARRPIDFVNAFGYPKIIYQYILDKYPKEKFDFYAYDWRKPLEHNVGGLIKTIQEYAQTGHEVYLLAHSMGGMLAKLAILELEKLELSSLVSKLISIGTPWRGSPDAFKCLSYGEPGIYSSLFQFAELFDDEKTRDLARQLPAVYQLLPSEEYYNHDKENNEGKFIAPNSDNQYMSYTEALGKVQSFYIAVNEITQKDEDVYNVYMKPIQLAMLKPLPSNISHDCLIGCNYPTLYQMPLENLEKRKAFKRECVFKDGDGVVPLYSAKPPHKANIYYVSGQHTDLLTLNPVLDFIDWCLKDKSADLPEFIYESPIDNLFKRSILAQVMCPVDTTILDENGYYITGTFDPSVPGVSELAYSKETSFFHIGESKYVFMKDTNQEDFKLKINSYDSGVADISVKVFDEDENAIEYSFDPLPVNNKVAAEVIITTNREKTEAKLYVDEKDVIGARIKRTKKDEDIRDFEKTPIPKLNISVESGKRTQKALYRKVFSGLVKINITSSTELKLKDIYFVINEGTPIRYEGEFQIKLPSGEYEIRAFGKDIYNRPTLDAYTKFKVDDELPETKIIAEINPEGLMVSFAPLTQGTKTTTYFRVDGSDYGRISPNETIPIPWGNLRKKQTEVINIEYYSENEFGVVETPEKSLKVSLGKIPILMWEDFNAYVTPEMIWGNAFLHNPVTYDDIEVSLIGKKITNATWTQRIPDDIKGIRFTNEIFEINVMYSEKYSLFFSGPPTEVLSVGQIYHFTFELITERSKDRVTHTKPEAYLRAVRSKTGDKKLKVKLEDGVFKSQFEVDESFLRQKYKLVISDMKNTHPPLREIPLMLSDED